jgi:hypothetical protein
VGCRATHAVLPGTFGTGDQATHHWGEQRVRSVRPGLIGDLVLQIPSRMRQSNLQLHFFDIQFDRGLGPTRCNGWGLAPGTSRSAADEASMYPLFCGMRLAPVYDAYSSLHRVASFVRRVQSHQKGRNWVAHLRNRAMMPCQTSRRMILTSCSGILAKSAWESCMIQYTDKRSGCRYVTYVDPQGTFGEKVLTQFVVGRLGLVSRTSPEVRLDYSLKARLGRAGSVSRTRNRFERCQPVL